MNYATYRIGEGKSEPFERDGSEMDEKTTLGMDDFIKETEELIGRKISMIWFGRTDKPETLLCEEMFK